MGQTAYNASGYGDMDWSDDVDNWTDHDVTWLQERTITRLNIAAVDPTAGTPGAGGGVDNVSAGRVFYRAVSGGKDLVLSIGSGIFNRILASRYLTNTDTTGTPTTAEIRHTGRSAGKGIIFASNADGFSTSDIKVTNSATYDSSTSPAMPGMWLVNSDTKPDEADVPDGTVFIS